MPVRFIRNNRDTNWESFQEGLRVRLERVPEVNIKDGARLGLGILSVQQTLISACENNCHLKPAKTHIHSLKWISELEFLRKRVRQLFNKCRADKNPQIWELYKEIQRRYRTEVRKASKHASRTTCSSVNDLPMSAILQKAVSRDPKIKLGSLVAPSWRRMQFEGETLELFLTTHFCKSEVTAKTMVLAASHCDRSSDWRGAVRVVTYRRV